MPETTKKSEVPVEPDRSKESEIAAEKRLDKLASEAAKRAGKTERRYDESHDIFTK